MKIILEKEIKPQIWELFVKYYEKKNDDIYRAIVEYIFLKNSNFKSNKEEYQKLSANLFFRKDEIYAKRNLEYLIENKLLEKKGEFLKLTERGEYLRQSGEMFVPKEWIYQISFVSNDPLLGNTVLEMDELKIKPNTYKELFDSKLEQIPEDMKRVEGLSEELFGKGLVQFEQLNNKGKKIDGKQMYKVFLNFNEREHKIEISKKSQENDKITRPVNNILQKHSMNEVKSILLQCEKYVYDIDNDKVILGLKELLKLFDEGNEGKILSQFSTDIKINDPFLMVENINYGKFNPVNLKDIKIDLKDVDAANFIARKLLLNKIKYYTTKVEYQKYCHEVNKDMEIFGFEIILPKFEQLILSEGIKKSDEKYWYIEAINDLLIEEELF